MPEPLSMDDWPDIDSVANFDHGPVTGYAVDRRDVMDIISEVTQFYDERWFSRSA
jgi:hypothetical protein